MRYGQGIWTESNAPAPTMWKEPKAMKFSPPTLTTTNTGATRNYGGTPDYVDTMPARWTVKESAFSQTEDTAKAIKKFQNRPITAPAETRTLTRPTEERKPWESDTAYSRRTSRI